MKKTMGEKSEAWDPGTNMVMNSLGFHCAFCFSELNMSVNWKHQWIKIKTKQSKSPLHSSKRLEKGQPNKMENFQTITIVVAQKVNNLPTMWEIQVRSLGWEDPLEEAMATHSSIPAW